MNKKVLAAVGISGLLMAGGVLSASASTSGYDLLKTSIIKTHQVNSVTSHIQGSFEDNGKVVYQFNGLMKDNSKAAICNTTINVKNGGKTEQVALINKDHQLIVKSSNDDNYYVEQKQDKHGSWNQHKPSAQMQKDAESIFDSFTKNYQDKIVIKDLANGNTGLEVDLSKNEIPAVGQAMVSFFLKNADQHQSFSGSTQFGSFQFGDFKPELTKLTNNISISRIVLQGEVNKDQYLVGEEATVYISGDEANGTHHDVVFHLSRNLENINSTVASGIDLTGKNVIKVKESKNQWGHWGK